MNISFFTTLQPTLVGAWIPAVWMVLVQFICMALFKEGGRRKLLNLGHTFGHAIEKVSGFAIPHGEAVAMGMRLVGKDVPEIDEILDAYGFGCYDVSVRAEVLSAVTNDKKRSGDSITLIIPREIGDCELVETPMSEVGRWLPEDASGL